MNDEEAAQMRMTEEAIEVEIAAYRATLRNLRLIYVPCLLATLWLVYDQGLMEGRWWPVLVALAVAFPFSAYIAHVSAKVNLARLRLRRLRRG